MIKGKKSHQGCHLRRVNTTKMAIKGERMSGRLLQNVRMSTMKGQEDCHYRRENNRKIVVTVERTRGGFPSQEREYQEDYHCRPGR